MKIGTDAVLIGAWAPVQSGALVLDIGTGCGIIALMIAQRCGDCIAEGIEPDENAFHQACENAAASPFFERTRIFHSALQEFTPGVKYDLIVSNPPFFENSLLSGDQRKNSARHTVGLTFSELFRFASEQLNPDGRISVIIPASSSAKVISDAAASGLFPERICTVYSHADKPAVRMMMDFSGKNKEAVREDLVLFVSERIPTDEYKALTRDFYLHF